MKWAGLFAAIFVAALAAFMVLRVTSTPEAPPPQANNQMPAPVAPTVETVSVYVVASPIPVGTIITEQMLDTQPWPKHLLLNNFISDPQQGRSLIGMVSRSEIQAREPIIRSKLANVNDPNFIAGALPKGLRAVSIQTNVVDGVAGFVFPGDRVDAVVTHKVQKPELDPNQVAKLPDAAASEEVTETLVSNSKVMAVDQRASGGADPKKGVTPAATVTLMATPEDVQRLRLGEKTGELSLALRSINDKDTVDSVAVTRKMDLTQMAADGSIKPSAAGAATFIPVTVVRGTQVEDRAVKLQREQALVNSMSVAAAGAGQQAPRSVP